MNTKAMTLRMPEALHDALRLRAFKDRTSITAIVLSALEGGVEKPGTLCDARACWNAPDRVVRGGFHFCTEHGPGTVGAHVIEENT